MREDARTDEDGEEMVSMKRDEKHMRMKKRQGLENRGTVEEGLGCGGKMVTHEEDDDDERRGRKETPEGGFGEDSNDAEGEMGWEDGVRNSYWGSLMKPACGGRTMRRGEE